MISVSNLFLSFALVLLSSCVTRLPTPDGVKEISLSDYERLVRSKTQDSRVYNGFMNQLEIYGTRVDAEMNDALLSHSARLYQWSAAKYSDERDKTVLKQGTQSEFMLSFFTPERKNDDLNRSKSVWKIYLEVDGVRYEGKATKDKRNLTEIQTFFPHHNRWFTPYLVSFPVSTSLSERKTVTFIITGPAGSSQLTF